MSAHALLEPHVYFPPQGGKYAVAPDLKRFDARAAGIDSLVFQLDREFFRYRAAKAAPTPRSVVVPSFHGRVAAAARRWIVDRLCREHPAYFRFVPDTGNSVLTCSLTGSAIPLDDSSDGDALSAIAREVQEDFAVLARDGGRHVLAAAFVALPSGWDPPSRVGRTFAEVHAPVPGAERIVADGERFARLMCGATDGLVRFGWGITFDDRLDQHPSLPRTAFDAQNPRAFLRVERQTMWGLPGCDAAIFTIRVYVYDVSILPADGDRRLRLCSSIESMSPETLDYKNLAAARDPLLRWLRGG